METLRHIYDTWYADGSTDKGTAHSYIDTYEVLLAPYRQKTVCLLEIGVHCGGSLAMWCDYFPSVQIIGLDVHAYPMHHRVDGLKAERVICNAADRASLDNALAQSRFDIIIDDGSHALCDQMNSFSYLYHRLNPGGLYVIEDIQDIDKDRAVLESLRGRVLDLRASKNRYDDVLVVVRKSS